MTLIKKFLKGLVILSLMLFFSSLYAHLFHSFAGAHWQLKAMSPFFVIAFLGLIYVLGDMYEDY